MPSQPMSSQPKPFACRLGIHAWHRAESEPGFPLIVCMRCGKQEAPSRPVAVRLGWDQHTHG